MGDTMPLTRLTTAELFERLRLDAEEPPPPPKKVDPIDEVLDAYAQAIGGRLIIAEADHSGYPLPAADRKRARAMIDRGDKTLRRHGLRL